MKKIIFLIIFLYSFNNYSQSQKDSLKDAVNERIKERKEDELDNEYYSQQELDEKYITENNIFQSLAKPDENSDLSIFFKENLDLKLLKKIDFSVIKSLYPYKNISNKIYNYTIRLIFEINKKNKATNIQINTGNNDLNKEIKEIFKNYPLEKLSIDESSKTGTISIQLFAKENKKTIIKASTFPVIDQVPVVKNCENTSPYRHSCLYKNLNDYILANISLSNISKQKLSGDINIRPRFSVDSNGKIFRVNSIAPNKIIKDEIDRIIKSYDQIIAPAMRNKVPTSFFYDTNYLIIIEKNK